MKKLNEELLNKYIDNELSSEELKTFNESINSDPEAIQKIKAVKLVESTIAKSEITQAPMGFTDKLMMSINTSAKAVKEDNKFFKMIISIFAVLIVGIFATTFATVSWGNVGFTDKIKEFVDGVSFDGAVSFLQNENFLMLCGGIIIMLGFSALLIFESHKSFKHKLNTYLN